MKRQGISKNKRFDIFARDNFTCQYCGKKAPNVILEVDHIIPVSKGGDNKLTNLITSCFECNRGKTNKKLKENIALEKQMNELEIINEKRNQLELIAKWQKQLNNIDKKNEKIFLDKYFNLTNKQITLNKVGKNTLKKGIKDFGLNLILECLEISTSKYDNTEDIFRKTFGIAKNKSNPVTGKINLIKNICYRNFRYFDNKYFHYLINENIKKFDIEVLDIILDVIDSFRSWNEFKNYLEKDVINE